MAQVLIRKLDESVVKRLKETAVLHGHSLEQEVRDILTQAAKPKPEERRALAERLQKLSKWTGGPDSTQMIREDRDSR